MNDSANVHRRRAPRVEAALDVRFSINGGPERLSNTLNFTSRSLTIRSDCTAQKGDKVVVRFGALPAISGEVARIFPEGFAAVLNEDSLELMAASKTNKQTDLEADFADVVNKDNISSPFIRPRSSVAARARFSTTNPGEGKPQRHFLFIITADPAPLSDISSIWLKSDQTRWTAHALHFDRSAKHGYVIITLNEWQMHMAGAYGLTISVINTAMQDWSFAIDAVSAAQHLYTTEPKKMTVNV